MLSVLGGGGSDPFARWFHQAEGAVRNSGAAWTFLRPGRFMSNALQWAPMIKRDGRVTAPFGRRATASIDPAIARTTRAIIRSFAEENQSAVLWTSHNMYEVEEVCHRVLFLSHGRILLVGDPKSLPHEHGAANLEDLFVQVANEQLRDGSIP